MVTRPFFFGIVFLLVSEVPCSVKYCASLVSPLPRVEIKSSCPRVPAYHCASCTLRMQTRSPCHISMSFYINEVVSRTLKIQIIQAVATRLAVVPFCPGRHQSLACSSSLALLFFRDRFILSRRSCSRSCVSLCFGST